MTRTLSRSVVRFATVGVVNTVIDVVLFWALHAPLGIVAANFVSTSAGMTFSFLANGRHTFGAEQVTVRQGVLFLATNAYTMWILQPLLIHTAYDVVSTPLMVAKMVALGGSVVTNFLLYRHVVWPAPALHTQAPADDLLTTGRDPARQSAELVETRSGRRAS